MDSYCKVNYKGIGRLLKKDLYFTLLLLREKYVLVLLDHLDVI